MEKINQGDKVKLVRRYSEINGWSIKESLDGKIAVVIENKENRYFTVDIDGERYGVFKDSIIKLRE